MINNFVAKFIKYVESGYLSEKEIAKIKAIIPKIKNQKQKQLIEKIIAKKGILKLADADYNILTNLFSNSHILVIFQQSHTKQPKTFEQQIDLLKSRNLIIADNSQAIEILKQISYYHLRGYFLPFETRHELNEENKFINGTTFEDIFALHQFDNRLQNLIFKSIKLIEIYLRTSFIYELAVNRSILNKLKLYSETERKIELNKYDKQILFNLIGQFPEYKQILEVFKNNGVLFNAIQKNKLQELLQNQLFLKQVNNSHAYLDENNFVNQANFNKSKDFLITALKDNQEIFINHYYLFYNQPEHPPIWTVFEVLTFHQLSWWIANTKSLDSQIIFSKIGFSDSVMKKLIRTLVVVRNIIAHHGRLVYRNIPYFDILPTDNKILYSLFVYEDKTNFSKRLFNVLLIIAYMTQKISNSQEWCNELEAILLAATDKQRHLAGCPKDWQVRLKKLSAC